MVAFQPVHRIAILNYWMVIGDRRVGHFRGFLFILVSASPYYEATLDKRAGGNVVMVSASFLLLRGAAVGRAGVMAALSCLLLLQSLLFGVVGTPTAPILQVKGVRYSEPFLPCALHCEGGVLALHDFTRFHWTYSASSVTEQYIASSKRSAESLNASGRPREEHGEQHEDCLRLPDAMTDGSTIALRRQPLNVRMLSEPPSAIILTC